VLHVGANAGYAITPLESMFFDAGVELAEGNANLVHFAYRNLEKGRPRNLPEGFGNIIAFDFHRTDRENLAQLADYVDRHRIALVLFFDMQPVHPLIRPLRRAGARTVLAYWGAMMSSPMPAWKLALKRLEVALSRSKVDGLIFESRAMANLGVRGRGVSERMLDIVPLGVDTDLFPSGPSDHVYGEFGFPRERKVVVYAGHMEQRKGVRTLVEAAIDLLTRRGRRDVCFLLCGNRDQESRLYESVYDGMGLDEWIRFGGYRGDMPEVYRSCFCGVIPSTGWDSFPRTSLEMAACGLPVIASRLHGLPEAVQDGRTGLLFPPGDWRALADVIEHLLDHPALAAEYGARGRERCERELNLRVQRERFLAVLKKRMAQAR
jgi:glycosyltransferase involved in cell wall biosynthesis